MTSGMAPTRKSGRGQRMNEGRPPARFAALRLWCRRLLLFLFFQVATQGLTFAAGLIVINSLDKTSYAHYLIVTSLSATALVLCQSGVSSTVMSRGGQVRGSFADFSSIVVAAFAFRRRSGIAVSLLCAPAAAVLLLRTGASAVETVVYTSLLLLGVATTLQMTGLGEVMSLESEYTRLQRISVGAATVRLLAVAVLFLSSAFSVAAALIANVAGTAVQAWRLRRGAAQYVSLHATALPLDRRLVRDSFRKLLPPNAFSAVQGQMLTLVLGGLGLSQSLAEFGALSRFALAFAFVTSATGLFLAPRLARQVGRTQVQRAFFTSLLLASLSCVLLWLLATLSATTLLATLGDGYQGLEAELSLILLAAAVSALVGVLSLLNQSRGWIGLIWLSIPTAVVVTAGSLRVLDVSELRQAAYFGLAQALAMLGVQLVQSFAGLRNLQSTP